MHPTLDAVSGYLLRMPGGVAHWAGDSLTLKWETSPFIHTLNRTAAALWLSCDGMTPVTGVVKELVASQGIEGSHITEELLGNLQELQRLELLVSSPTPLHPRPLLSVGFAGFGEDWPIPYNYFSWMLTHQFDVVVVDYQHQSPDLIFYRSPAISQIDSNKIDPSRTQRVLVSALDQDPDFLACDYAFSPRKVPDQYTQVHSYLPGWAYCMDWQTYQKNGAAYGGDAIPLAFLPENVCQKLAHALFDMPVPAATSVRPSRSIRIIPHSRPESRDPKPQQEVFNDLTPRAIDPAADELLSDIARAKGEKLHIPNPDVANAAWQVKADGHPIPVLLRMRHPRIILFSDVFTQQECQALVAKARQRLKASKVVDTPTGGTRLSAVRTSQGMFFKREEDALIARLDRRLAHLLNWPLEASEGLQILRYSIGQEYQPHHDYFDPKEVGTPQLLARGGQRVATLVIYLNEPELGGGTCFPDSDLVVAPKQGLGLFFAWEHASPESKTLHGSLPVIAGEKWVAIKWFREHP